jgi:hypothetical protein
MRAHMAKGNGQPDPHASKSTRAAQRIVLLAGDERSDVKKVLAEYQGAELPAVDVGEEARRHGAEHSGKIVAAEWQDGDGWRRYLWCKR